MFSCPLHSWSSHEFPCPACYTTVTSSTGVPESTPCPECQEKEKKLLLVSEQRQHWADTAIKRQEMIEAKDQEILRLKNERNDLANSVIDKAGEMVRLKEVLKQYWAYKNPHSKMSGHTDGENIIIQNRLWEKFLNNL